LRCFILRVCVVVGVAGSSAGDATAIQNTRPLIVVAIAIKGQVDDVGLWNGLLKALVLMATGFVLFPIAKWWKTKKGYADDPSLSGEFDVEGVV
jgi:hypothetical protein